MLKKIAYSFIALVGLAGSAGAFEMKPIHAYTVDFGGTSALSYYTDEGKAYRLVTLLQSDDVNPPVQIVSMLRPGDHAVISVPRGFDEKPVTMWVTRVGDSLLMGPKNGFAGH